MSDLRGNVRPGSGTGGAPGGSPPAAAGHGRENPDGLGPVVRALEAEVAGLRAEIRELRRSKASGMVRRYLAARAFFRRPGDSAVSWIKRRMVRLPGVCVLGRLEHYPPRPFAPERFPSDRRGLELPSVAIVIPTFGPPAFLEEAIASVVEQPGVVVRCYVCDGGSGPATEALLRRWSDRLAGWVSEPDGGQADAIRKGFGRVDGEIMGWLNADDRLMPGALRFVAEHFARHPELDALYGHRVVIDSDGREVGRWMTPPHSPEMLRVVDYVPQETLFWRRRIWDRVGGVDTRFHFALDWDLLLRFQAVGARIQRVPWFLGCFRAHSGQKTRTMIADLGRREIEGLRERANGRPVPRSEVVRLSNRAILAGLLLHQLWRLGIRI